MWSAKNNLFFPKSILDDYVNAGDDLSDIIDIPYCLYEKFNGIAPTGKCRGVSNDLMPMWVDVPPPTRDELIKLAEAEKHQHISYANNVINENMWQTKLLLGRITNDEKRRLNLWLDYIDAVNAIDTSTAPDIKLPTPPVELAK